MAATSKPLSFLPHIEYAVTRKQQKLPQLPAQSSYIDSHCHLDMEAYQQDLDQVLTRAKQANIVNIITIGIDLASSVKAVELAVRYPGIFATIGIHPHDVENIGFSDYDLLQKLYDKSPEQIKAVGEIGLDYFKNYTDHRIQRRHFARQLELAKQLRLPVVIHNRNADTDCYDILKTTLSPEYSGIMHCFGSDYSFAKKILDLGMQISFSGVVTFKNAKELHDVAKKIPLQRMLVETDGPFLAPAPFRGKRNEPAHVRYIVAAIARLRGISIEAVAEATTDNARAFFTLL